MRLLRYIGKRVSDKTIDWLTGLAIASMVGVSIWAAVPEEKKETLRTVVSIEGLQELTDAIKDFREYAQIVVEEERAK